MKEQLYTIPVTDAFESGCECPLCKLKQELERNAIEYTLGPSYMEDDNRAMILSTHMSKVTKELRALSGASTNSESSFFKRKSDSSGIGSYVERLKHNCFICNRMNQTFDRYVDTIFHLYKKDSHFPEKMKASKGFCTYHFAILFDRAPEFLSKDTLSQFRTDLQTVYFANMERMQEDIEWFINKFDYRYQNEPWKNAKDALPRSILKTHSAITPDTEL